jgi:TatD DNase family protein
MWIDTHSHMDADQLQGHASEVFDLTAQRAAGSVALCVIPAVQRRNFSTVQRMARTYRMAYALGIHPLFVPDASHEDLNVLGGQLQAALHDKRLVAVGEMGLDFFIPVLCSPAMREKQTEFYRAQLKLAKQCGLPVILHVRKSADQLLKALREIGSNGGIAHAFNGSAQQAAQFIDMGFCLGFGGTVTYERALHIRSLATHLPASAIVMETDAPDMPPAWLYARAQARAAGQAQGINSPLELPRIGAVLAELRGVSAQAWAQQTTQNALRVLPRLKALL